MKAFLIVGLLISLSVSGFAQEKPKTDKAQEKDTAVFFYAWFKFNNGPYVVSQIDSIKTTKKDFEKDILKLNEMNKLKILATAKSQTDNKYPSPNIDASSNLLELQANQMSIKSKLEAFLKTHKGDVINLLEFKFIKPNDSKFNKERVRPADYR